MDSLELWGAVATLILIVILVAHAINDYVPSWRSYPILILFTIPILTMLALAGPFPVSPGAATTWKAIAGIALSWQGMVVTGWTFTELAAEYWKQFYGIRRTTSYRFLIPLNLLFWLLYYWKIARR